MKFKILTSLLLTVIFFSLFSAKSVFAETFTLTGNVIDNTNTALDGVTVDILNPGTTNVVETTTTDSNGDYSISVEEGTYDVRVTALPEDNLASVTALAQEITGNKVLDFALSLEGQLYLEGYIYDEYGNPMENQTVTISLGGSGYNATTDSTGQYTFTDLPSG